MWPFVGMLLLALIALAGISHSQNTQPQNSFSSQVLAANPSVYLTFNNPSQLFRENTTGVSFIAGGAGTIASGQTGFDNKEPNNTAASFPYNSYIYAPNFTLGDINWNVPFTMMFQIDRLNWARSGTHTLLSKGNVSGNTTPWWTLQLGMASANVAQICFTTNGSSAAGHSGGSICSPTAIDVPNGSNYNVVVTGNGTGLFPSGFSLYVNGVAGIQAYSGPGSGTPGYGGATIAIGGSGTGYANTTPYESVGGGANCIVNGTMTASSGVPSAIGTISYVTDQGCTSTPTLAFAPYIAAVGGSGTGYANSTAFTSTGGGAGCAMTGTMTSVSGVPSSITTNTGSQACTSAPTIVLTAPTGTGATVTAIARPGTGATLTATLTNTSFSSATTAPLYVSGKWSATAGSAWTAAASAGASTNSAEAPTLIDEFAMFSQGPSQSLIQSLFYQTKFYQGLLRPVPAVPYVLIFSNDGCNDLDNLHALAATIAAQKLGYIKLAGVENTDRGAGALAIYRQMLDQAGLAHIPMSVPSSSTVTSTLCTVANANTYNSATPQTYTAYPTSASMYRTIFAANPTTPVYIMLGGTFRGVADLMQSGADSISSLTGAQLVAQNASNGGAIYAQGLGANIAFTSDNTLLDWTAGQYVVNNNCGSGGCAAATALPIYWYGGSPQSVGPDVLYTRNAKDPMFLFATSYGSDGRQAFDSLPTSSFISNFFSGGVDVAISGSGTGYANATAFTSTGGGTGCVVNGVMNSVGGVPSSITYPSGYAAIGVGYGCTQIGSPPTIVLTAPTGTGVVLTATTTAQCGTVTITGAASGSTSTSTCSKHYFLPIGNNGQPGLPTFLTWFLNALIDPPPNGAPRVR